MQGNYQNFDKYDEVSQSQKGINSSQINRVNVYFHLFSQLLYLTGWLAVFLFTDLGYNLLLDKQIFAITFTISGVITLILQSILLNIKKNSVLKQSLGIAFLIINGFFVAYLILIIQSNIQIYYYQYIFVDIQVWYFVFLMELILAIFMFTSYQKYRWMTILIVPALLNLITGFTYIYFYQQFYTWLLILCVVCLYTTQMESEIGEFYLSLNILGFITLFLIRVAQYIDDTFRTQKSIFVTKMQEQGQLKFIFFTYMIAAISTLLTPLINQIFNISGKGLFCLTENEEFIQINSNLWIILGLNYFVHLFLYLVHRYSEFQIKSMIAIAYFLLHQLSITGLYFAFSCRIKNYYYLYPETFYYYVLFLQFQFILGAITIQIKQKFCSKSLYHVLKMVPIIAHLVMLIFYFIQPSVILLVIIVNSFLIIYMGSQCMNEDNFFSQFREDEIMISGALFSDPLALFLYQSVFVHVKIIQS